MALSTNGLTAISKVIRWFLCVRGRRLKVPGSLRNVLAVLIFILLTAGIVEAACPEGDLYVDCYIDCLDVEILARQWLDGAGSAADLIGDDGVNMRDFAKLAANWRQTGEPTGSLQVIISPLAAIELGAKWRIEGDVWRDSGELVADLPVGSYTIEFGVIDTWARPAEQEVAVAEGLITDIRASYKHPLVINEFMASNSMFMLDPQGEDDDWIEIHNVSEEAFDIGGLYMTDNLGDPTRWRIPDDNPALTTIPSGGYLVIWADNDEHDYPDGLHAGFELNDNGNDEIGLFDSNGTSLIDSVAFPDQDSNISYGRFPDGNDTWRFFPIATPRSENLGAYLGEVADTRFSHNRGYYDTPFYVTIATETRDAVIYYTIDGSEPGKFNGQFYTGTLYTGAIRIAKTACLRAKAVKTGWKPSNADAQTYIFLDNVLAQSAYPSGFPTFWNGTRSDYEMDPAILNDSRYRDRMKSSLLSLPVISIATEIDNLFDSDTGIYANPTNRGIAWEKPASAEYFDSSGAEQFQINCGLRIQGGWFRPLSNCRKKSFRLLFKGMYGPTKLDFPIFGDNGVDSFDTITLRAGANDGYSWSAAKYTEQYTRDQFGRSLQAATGHAGSRGNFVHLYLNGLYWGLYNPCERPDNSFAASHYGGKKDDWDSIKTGKEVLSGTIGAWNQMVAKCAEAAGSDAEYQRLQGNNPDGTPNQAYQHLLDIPNYIDYLIVNLWAGNWD
ncbi:MAG: CotH kinase family protein, partial [Planctomycetota bacterium]